MGSEISFAWRESVAARPPAPVTQKLPENPSVEASRLEGTSSEAPFRRPWKNLERSQAPAAPLFADAGGRRVHSELYAHAGAAATWAGNLCGRGRQSWSPILVPPIQATLE